MTVESLKTKVIYKGNGSTSVWPFPYQYSKTDTIFLMFTDAKGKDSIVTSNYHIDVNTSGNTSVVYPVTGAAIASGTKLTVFRNTPLTQIVDLIYGGAFNPEMLESSGFDRIVMMVQEIQEQIDRAVKVSISDEGQPKTAEEFYADMEEFTSRSESAAASSEASAVRSEAAAEKSQELFDMIEPAVEQGLQYIGDAERNALNTVGATLHSSLEQMGGYVDLARKWAINPEDVPVRPGEFSALHWARKAQQAMSAGGYIDYTIGVVDSSGRVHIEYALIGHPPMDRIINPIVNILARSGYMHTITDRSLTGFDILIYRPDGTQGVDGAEYVDCGTFECGDGTQCGQAGEPVVRIAISIPIPNGEPPSPENPSYIDCGKFQCGDGTQCGQPGSAFQ